MPDYVPKPIWKSSGQEEDGWHGASATFASVARLLVTHYDDLVKFRAQKLWCRDGVVVVMMGGQTTTMISRHKCDGRCYDMQQPTTNCRFSVTYQQRATFTRHWLALTMSTLMRRIRLLLPKRITAK